MHSSKRWRPTPQSGGTGQTAIDQNEAVAVMLEKLEVCRDLFHGFDWTAWVTGGPQPASALLPPPRSTSSPSPTARTGSSSAVTDLLAAFALAVPHEEAARAP